MKPWSFTLRLIFWYSGIVAIILAAFGFCSYKGFEHYMAGALLRNEMIQAQKIAKEIPGLDQDEIGSEMEVIYASETNNHFMRLITDTHTVLYCSGSPKNHLFDPAQISWPRFDRTDPFGRHTAIPDNKQLYIADVPLNFHGQYAVMEVGITDEDIVPALDGLLLILETGLPVLLMIAIFGGYLFIQRTLAPVKDMFGTAEHMSLQQLGERLPATGSNDFFEQLYASMNRMIGRLEGSFQQVKKFTEDASHELRAPLAVMQTELESIMRAGNLPGNLKGKVENLLEENARLNEILSGLFTLARMDAGKLTMLTIPVDLSALVIATSSQLALLAEAKQVALKMDIAPGITIIGDPDRIKQALVNVIDNAIKYTRNYGVVIISLATTNENAIIRVTDNGTGIANESLPYIFDRFYREDTLRGTRSKNGAGLGLAIAKSICHAHHGTIKAANNLDEGCCITIELPLSVKEGKSEDSALL